MRCQVVILQQLSTLDKFGQRHFCVFWLFLPISIFFLKVSVQGLASRLDAGKKEHYATLREAFLFPYIIKHADL